jgi:hypothetical protein
MAYIVIIFLVLISSASFLVQLYQQYHGLYVPIVSGDYRQLCSELSAYLDLLRIDGVALNDRELCSTTYHSQWMDGERDLSYAIVAAVEGISLTAYQQKVHASLAEHITANLRTLLGDRRNLKVRSVVQGHFGLQALTRVQTVGSHERNFMASDEVVRHVTEQQKTADGNSCNGDRRCQPYRLILHFPDSTAVETSPGRIVKDPVTEDGEQASSTTGFMIDDNTCFISLPLQDTDQYDPADADAIYNATALSVDCLRRLHGVRVRGGGHRSADTHENDISAETAIGRAEAAEVKLVDLVSTVQCTAQQLDSLVALFGYREDLSAFVTMSGRHRRDIAAVIGKFSEIRQSIEGTRIASTEQQRACTGKSGGKDTNVCSTGAEAVAPLEALVYAAADTMTGLVADPAGGKREPAPLEQHFAIYGPYWLPLLVPALRGLRMALTSTTVLK